MKMLSMDGLNNGIHKNWCSANHETTVFMHLAYTYMYILRIYCIYLAGVRVRFVTSLNLLEMTNKDFRGRGGGLNRLITS